jgi:hypothetical protein
MSEPTQPAEPVEATEQAAPEDPEERIKHLTSKYEIERKHRNKAERELAQLRNSQLTESEKAVEEAKAVGRKEGARSAGVRLVAAEFRAKAAEAKLPSVSTLLDVIDLTKFVDDAGEPDTEMIQNAVDKIAEGLAAAENGRGKVRAPEIPKGVHPKIVDEDWLRSKIDQGG